MQHINVIYLFTALAGTVGCSRTMAPTAATGVGLVATDRSAYRIAEEGMTATVNVTFSNTTPDTIFIKRCGDGMQVALQRNVKNDWLPLRLTTCATVGRNDLIVLPGTKVVFPVGVRAGAQLPLDELRGTFRLVVVAYRSSRSMEVVDTSRLLSVEMRTTPPFEITP
jgi:hypothetical protein